MYNRYVRNDAGRYERIPTPDSPPPGRDAHAPAQEQRPHMPPPPREDGPPPKGEYRAPPSPPREPENKGFLSDLLRRLNLEHIDTGDLLLLVILFLLFKDGEDEELLIALGLLLIL